MYPRNFDRRQALLSMLLGTGSLGLRALATGLPISLLAHPRRALAQVDAGACISQDRAQFVILNTSGAGDPLNANVPGTYDDPNIVHPTDPAMAATSLTIGGQTHTAAAVWSTLPQAVLDRTCFWHLMTNTPIHPKEPDVLKLMGQTYAGEMLPSLLAKHLAPCLQTVQTGPISLGAKTPAEGLSYQGTPLPIIPALALKSTLTSPAGPLTRLQALRDHAMNDLYDLYKSQATPAQRTYIDSLVTSQEQVRHINQSLLDALSSIKDNSPASQIVAAVTLLQMRVTPVVAIHLPFGGDNHRDIGLTSETTDTVASVGSIAALMQALATAGLADKVTFLSLNVFGRTLAKGSEDGRQHNANHQVSLCIGKPFRGAVIGGVGPVGKDFGALAIDSGSGKASDSGDVKPSDTLASFGKTVLSALAVPQKDIDADILSGKVVSAAIA